MRFAGFSAGCPSNDSDSLFLGREDSFCLWGGTPKEKAVGKVRVEVGVVD